MISQTLGRWIDPAVVFDALYADAETAFWLDSGNGLGDGIGTSYVGAASTESAAVLGAAPVLAGAGVLEQLRAAYRRFAAPNVPGDGALPAFRLGWVGWLAYDGADSRFMFVDRMIAFDHTARTVTLLALSSPTSARWFSSTAADLTALPEFDRAKSPAYPSFSEQNRPLDSVAEGAVSEAGAGRVRWRHSEREYLELIGQCQQLIAAGEAYQLCLTNHIDVDVHPDPFETYVRLRELNPSHHGAFIRFGDVALLSASPERFLEITPQGTVTTRPIKGTRPRGESPQRDAERAAELRSSVKERAENVMIVDLMRNDLARVATTGSVHVEKLFDVESYASVHQLVSTVTARLAPESTAIDVIEACFPAGSMTGAPKISAMSILSSLEAGPRGVYAGAFGYLGLDGRVDLAMVIRSMMLTPAGASIGAGGGITALSVPAEEVAETWVKAAPLLQALGVLSAEGELRPDTSASIV
ncbi:aminodeoxychorismate synthase component I [Subtercola endophyticus]|uniref:aminodeoxychorismate synthase component I n=1 Tax=Subtercola endophyticus TaxID=2895559 RepID=UPI001E5BA34D|nr:aminodeoxychorismate synthase component I [Subtercola endophyticus]UFS60760.1 aminodeoxychorismate synthase component I [Subtercola endophyticus]